ncbi:radical SAM protein, partial [Ruminococcaceae bacterium OttesenSCG-928-D13]|nr:radical SAM protein [Ruminococcaceae bacterium OttesenSCG-928-D13]
MKRLSVMLKPASSLCNLRCRYCFYADVSSMRGVPNYGIMSDDTAREVIGNIYRDLEDGDEITLAFQGGEPTLAGLDFFKSFVAEAERQPVRARVNWALQTNGVLLDRDWCAFLREKRFLVGLSLDGD